MLGRRRLARTGYLLRWCWFGLAQNGRRTLPRTVSFVNDVMPVLTKEGCNSGACHAKAGGGQNGFQLSLLGFEPIDDYESLVKAARGRRLYFGAPQRSLLLRKPSGQMKHGGGVRLSASSPGYALIREWIRQGAPLDKASAPKLIAIEVRPDRGSIKRHSAQRRQRRYSDGSVRDVTGLAHGPTIRQWPG